MPHELGHRESTGAKRWLEENISKKGISRAYNKASAYQAGEMSKEVIPGLSQGDLYGMVTGGVTGKASSLKGIYKAGRSMFSKWKGGGKVASEIADVSKIKPRSVGAFTEKGEEIGKISKVYPELAMNPKSSYISKGVTHNRPVAMVEMSGKSGSFWQPFYKSSGTSGEKVGEFAARKGVWEPFLGTGRKGSKVSYYSDPATGRSNIQGTGKGWFQKGWATGEGGVSKGQYQWAGSSGQKYAKYAGKANADIAMRSGPYQGVSKELSRLESGGYFSKLPTRKTEENVFLRSFGLNRPRSVQSW